MLLTGGHIDFGIMKPFVTVLSLNLLLTSFALASTTSADELSSNASTNNVGTSINYDETSTSNTHIPVHTTGTTSITSTESSSTSTPPTTTSSSPLSSSSATVKTTPITTTATTTSPSLTTTIKITTTTTTPPKTTTQPTATTTTMAPSKPTTIATTTPSSTTTPTTAPPSTSTTAPPSTSTTAPPSTSTTAPPSTSTTAPPSTSTTAPPSTSTTAPPSTSTTAPPSTTTTPTPPTTTTTAPPLIKTTSTSPPSTMNTTSTPTTTTTTPSQPTTTTTPPSQPTTGYITSLSMQSNSSSARTTTPKIPRTTVSQTTLTTDTKTTKGASTTQPTTNSTDYTATEDASSNTTDNPTTNYSPTATAFFKTNAQSTPTYTTILIENTTDTGNTINSSSLTLDTISVQTTGDISTRETTVSGVSTPPAATSSHTSHSQTTRPTHRTTTFRSPSSTAIPTYRPAIDDHAIFSLHFELTINGSCTWNTSSENLKERLRQLIFAGFDDIVEKIIISGFCDVKNSRRSLRSTRQNQLRNRNIVRTVGQQMNRVSVNFTASVKNLRVAHMTIKDFVGNISSSLYHNLTKLSTNSWTVTNTSKAIVEQLEQQSESLTECKAIIGSICTLGYKCLSATEDDYTAICSHECDFQTKDEEVCQNGGHCYFDPILKRTACRCTSTWLTVYYGDDCSAQTGQFATVLGFSIGPVILIIALIVIIAVIRFRRHHESQSNLSYNDKSALQSDFLSESGRVETVDINYRKSVSVPNYPVSNDTALFQETILADPNRTSCSSMSDISASSTPGKGSPTGSFTRQVGLSEGNTFVPNDGQQFKEELKASGPLIATSTPKTVDQTLQESDTTSGGTNDAIKRPKTFELGLESEAELEDGYDVITLQKTIEELRQESGTKSGGAIDVINGLKTVDEPNQESAIITGSSNDVIRRKKKDEVLGSPIKPDHERTSRQKSFLFGP